ncbi:non-homologous end-joining DNA ligase [Marixanthomonas spongiae]|uniref:ATP-dependent DNA ligase n=1 Tax=Marixanthomonas spongiae TaxID=2174845 RepID=A0A2U0I555_9FLAO|nr:non-homologous end-joining DNA ligase [Marixanthomonas spongiae]PVW16238.1 ATP-dependent DNA ligase [Marixanthomonas spongiae]
MKLHGIEITHPDKVIFPKLDATKRDMAQYYDKVAEKMLPYLKDRPLTLHRFPDGIDADGFYQKKAADYFPDFIQTIKVKTEDGHINQAMCNNKKSLLYLVNQGTIGFHIWLSKKDKLYKPDKVVFDLDPPKNSFAKVKEAAKKTHEFLKEKDKKAQLMTTGKNGFHVWYTMRRTKTYDELRPQLKEWAIELEEKHPDLFTTAVRKEKRDGKVFIDYLRNSYAQTSVCPYSLRPTENAGAATPLPWNKLDAIEKANQYHLKNIEAIL